MSQSPQQPLGHKLRQGAAWTYLQGGLGALIQFGAGIVMARLLDPSDFGVFFAVSAYVALLAAQVRFGLPSALLQAREVNEQQWQSAFWVMQGLALLCTLAVFAASDWLSEFYRDARYADLMRLMCITFFLAPFMVTSETRLRRDMEYPVISRTRIIAKFSGTALGIAAAVAGLGPYSLVVGGIFAAALSTIMLGRITGWHARATFAPASLRPLFSFGWRMHLNNSLSLAANRVDNMLLGRLAGLDLLGIYSRAFAIARLPVDNICTPLYQLVFGALSRIQDDHAHSRLMFQKVLCAVTSAVFPLLLWLIFNAEAFIHFLYGDKWLPAAEPFRLLALGSFVLVISITLSSLAAAQNLIARQTPIIALNLVLTIVAVVVGIRWGLTGVAAGISAKILVTNVLLVRMMQRSHLEMGWSAISAAVSPALMATLFTLLPAAAAAVEFDNLGWPATGAPHFFAMSLIIGAGYSTSWYLFARRHADDPVIAANLALLRRLLDRLLRRGQAS